MSEQLITGETARRLIKNAHNMVGRRYDGLPLWVLVSDLTAHGAGISQDICRSAKLDSHQIIKHGSPLSDYLGLKWGRL